MAPGLVQADQATQTAPPSKASGLGLTPEQVQTYKTDGYLVIPSFLSADEVTSLLTETSSLLQSFDLTSHPLTRFSTGESSDHVGDEYFLTSGSEVRFFFEEDAFDATTGALRKPKERAINKFGHNLHNLSPPFRRVTVNARTKAVAQAIGFNDPRVLQSMVICKQPEIGGAVPPHQDSTFLYTDPPSAVGFWFALEDATIRNGCLSFAPGSHRTAPVNKRFVRAEEGNVKKGTTFVDITDEAGRWPRNEAGKEGSTADEDYKIEEVKAGDLVVIHGNVLHKSEKNTSDKGRIIYTFHMIEGQEKYDGKNWLQIPGGPANFTQLYAEA